MLYNRGTGWADWELSNFWNRISYIDDFPYNILEALAEYLKTGEEQNVEFNAEGWFYTFRFTYNVKVGDRVVYESTVDFASDFICEIEKNLVSWSHFPANRKSDEDYLELVDLIVEVRTELLDDNLIDRWLEIIS
ncbi:hypothetical protein [uncultured Methanobrevibacter sp.]|uniref:hypothetical protein n=1 Tax=uncultured Methanobrevibacter sp. TaxID=253161 RepID=UPI002600E45E|nr:hypothetical protein [uncultured Methanobrevibacter sp.]